MNEPTRRAHAAAPPAPDFATRDPSSPAFWDERFQRGFTPWEQTGVPPAFESFAGREPLKPVLIPGCGSAREALWLAGRGWPVHAIDFSANAVAAAREQLGMYRDRVEQADFFTWTPPFTPGWIYERAFLCALPVARRNGYAARMAQLLPSGGLLAGFYFLGEMPKGPPFGIARTELEALLTPHFELIEDEPVTGSIPVFEGRERWMTWRRRD